MKTFKKHRINASAWFLVFVVNFINLLAAPTHKSGEILLLTACSFYLAILGAVVQGFYIERGYYQGHISALVVGTLVLIPVFFLAIWWGLDISGLMVMWLFIPSYCASFASYYLTELRPRH